ncbi:MAG: hypothetical protein M3467_00065 [Actinomycetota bacterium]|nr:hypothetical protein [Actinomycetota bacterium]
MLEDMSTTTAASVDLRAYEQSVRLDGPGLVDELRSLLGARLVAYVGAVRETRAVRQWAEGERTPSEAVVRRLRLAYRAAATITSKDSAEVAQAWFQGANPHLGEVAPARLLREGDLDEVGPLILAAAKAFAADG